MKKESGSLLEQFVCDLRKDERFSQVLNPEFPHLLDSFHDDYLSAYSDYTREFYDYHVYEFLYTSFVGFKNFPAEYLKIAETAQILDRLKSADKQIGIGRIADTDGKRLLENAVKETKDGNLSLVPVQNKQLNRVSASPGFIFKGDRFSVRRPKIERKYGHISKSTRIVVDTLLRLFDSYTTPSPNMDKGFWSEVFSVNMIGQFIRELIEHGNKDTSIANKLYSLRSLEKFLVIEGLKEGLTLQTIKKPSVKRGPEPVLDGKEMDKIYDYLDRLAKNSSEQKRYECYRNRFAYILAYETPARGVQYVMQK